MRLPTVGRWPLDAWLSRPAVWNGAIVGVIALQLVLTLGHWPWLDEYQALQLALQSPDLSALLASLRYEGHPPLWYLLLRGAAAVVPPGWVLAAVATPMAVAIQAIVLACAPFSRAQRLLLATSAFVLFEYGALSRSLTLGVLLLLIAFAFRRHRWSWAALALLPMADFLFGALSVIMVAIQWRDRRLWWPGIAAWMAFAVLAALSIRPPADMVPALTTSDGLTDFGHWLNRLSILLLPIQAEGSRLEWNQTLPFGLASIAGPLFLVFAMRQVYQDRFSSLLLAGFILLTALFSVAVYPLAIRHLSLIALLLILLIWRYAEHGRAPDRLFGLWLVGLSAGGLLSAGAALARPFDTAPAAAQAIYRMKLDRAHWVAFPDSRGQGVSALTGIAFHKLGRDCLQTSIRWNYKGTIRTPGGLTRALRTVTRRYGRVQLLTDMPIEATMDPRYVRPIAAIPAGYDGQEFRLYTVGSDLPATSRRPPPCTPGQRPLAIEAAPRR